MAGVADAFDELVAVETVGRLARGIDRRDEHGIGFAEALAKAIEQGFQPRVAMRLHDRDQLPLGRAARRAERRLDLGGMMGVIVVNLDTVPFPRAGEAAVDAFE